MVIQSMVMMSQREILFGNVNGTKENSTDHPCTPQIHRIPTNLAVFGAKIKMRKEEGKGKAVGGTTDTLAVHNGNR